MIECSCGRSLNNRATRSRGPAVAITVVAVELADNGKHKHQSKKARELNTGRTAGRWLPGGLRFCCWLQSFYSEGDNAAGYLFISTG